MGGFSTDGSRKAGIASLDLLAKETKKFKDGSGGAICKTSNSSVAKSLIAEGWVRADYNECRSRYPDYLKLYLAGSSKPEDYYQDQIFYILERKND